MSARPHREPEPETEESLLHASAIAAHGRAALILGPSGSGKSTLALECLALGARLLGDDRVCLRRAGGRVIAASPPRLAGVIEARGIGLLRAPVAAPAPVALVIDLGRTESTRLPPHRVRRIMGVEVPLCHDPQTRAFPAAIMQYLWGGRVA